MDDIVDILKPGKVGIGRIKRRKEKILPIQKIGIMLFYAFECTAGRKNIDSTFMGIIKTKKQMHDGSSNQAGTSGHKNRTRRLAGKFGKDRKCSI